QDDGRGARDLRAERTEPDREREQKQRKHVSPHVAHCRVGPVLVAPREEPVLRWPFSRLSGISHTEPASFLNQGRGSVRIVDDRMDPVPVSVALVAGGLAVVNPCGFPLLPAFLSFYLGADEAQLPRAPTRVLQGLLVGGLVALGFVGLSALVGLPV